MSEAADDGGSVLASYISTQLAKQDARKASLEQRGLAVITTSGVLVTLLFGLVALSTRSADTFILPKHAAYLLAIAVVCFAIAAVTAILTNVPIGYEEPDIEPIRKVARDEWDTPRPKMMRDAALTDLKVLADAKRKNDVKAKLLFRAVSFEVAAVVLVAAAVGVVVNGWALLAASFAALALGVVVYVRAYGWATPHDGTLGVLFRAAQTNWGGD